MLIFFDESFRIHLRTQQKLGVLAGIAIPEDAYASFHTDIFEVRKPYHEMVLKPADEIKGTELLRKMTFKSRSTKGYSYHWNLAEELLQFCASRKFKVFGIVCFRTDLQSLICEDDSRLDITFRYLFERVDRYVKNEFPNRRAKIVFDDRGVSDNNKNATAITNFFTKSNLGLSYDSIVKNPFFAVSQAHNYGLQLADLITTVFAMRFQGNRDIDPLWQIASSMIYKYRVGEINQSSVKVLKEWPKSNEKEVRRR